MSKSGGKCSINIPYPADPRGYRWDEIKDFCEPDELDKLANWLVGQTGCVDESGRYLTYPWDVRRGLELIRFGRPTYWD